VKEFRPIIRLNGKEVPYNLTYPKPDINWNSYFTTLNRGDVVRWEERDVTKTPWKPYKE
jgi:hypothetical protein